MPTRNPPGRGKYLICKRAVDVVVSAVGLLIAAPVLVLIAAAIRLDSAGPVVFRQTRVGRDGRLFTCLKFRTMVHNADPEVHRHYVQSLIRNHVSPREACAGYKMRADPRVTGIGRWLRRTSFDELPQLFNVLRGEMSLVGPRPPLPYEVAEYQDWHTGRLAAAPGITGWWQVRGRSRVPFDEMVRMDLDYIARQSLWLDLKILLLTIPAVLSGSGAE
jgi:exopolysaccharide biosynthesis polyprenyl glycosylphosphotransferase